MRRAALAVVLLALLTPACDQRQCLPQLSSCTETAQCCSGYCVAVNGIRAVCCHTSASLPCDAGLCCPPEDMQ